jgi:uncharacterized protein (DUF2235 family)
MDDPNEHSRRNIVLLSDGTGNSAGKLLKTNVWRLYQALDLSEGGGETPQIACYNDGVGTSSFKPLALLGGAFGWGLKRNILHLYEFLCRNYRPGDRIYLFGFSRGAFTVRILAGLILTQGLVRCSEEELPHHARQTYRAYRADRYNEIKLVGFMRGVRNAVIKATRWIGKLTGRAGGRRPDDAIRREPIDTIELIGVWDTVAAYGTPFRELTRGIDRWVWPLSMPDQTLLAGVKAARQALSLDDERDTFHPLLWDEVGSPNPERITQVWFSGMHADVGGGYADDALSREPLLWMMQEADKRRLRFRARAIVEEPPFVSRSAPLHDSRRGLGSYYRYQPRKISAWLDPPDPHARIMQDPLLEDRGLLKTVLIHESAITRIRESADGYAPLVLPRDYRVLGPNGTIYPRPETDEQAEARIEGTEFVWNNVWLKRVTYFSTVAFSLVLGAWPLFASNETAACEGPFCLLSPLISAAGSILPNFVSPWVDTFANHPFWFALAVLVLVLLQRRSARLARRIEDGMCALWSPLRRVASAPPRPGWFAAQIYGLRTGALYQRFFRRLKWRAVPSVAGCSILLVLAAVLLVGFGRGWLWFAERNGSVCNVGSAESASGDVLETRSLCTTIGYAVAEGSDYLIRFEIIEPWVDGDIVTDPAGFASDRSFRMRLAVPLRRVIGGNWFQPYLTIAPEKGARRTQPLELHSVGGNSYVGHFKAKATGDATVWVNDAILGFPLINYRFPLTEYYYHHNNRGSAKVTLEPLPADRP